MGLISNGTTIFDNGSMASGFGGSLKFISKATASASASIEFTSGIDSTYKEYIFYFVNIHPSNNGVALQFNMSTDGGSTYAVTKTSTAFSCYHNEADTDTALFLQVSDDLAQQTGDAHLGLQTSNDNDGNTVGTLRLFNPSSSTYVKHWISDINDHGYDYSVRFFGAGYGNTNSPVNAVKFRVSSGNIDSGDILLFGVN